MSEFMLGILVIGVLFIADPDRLQIVIEKMRDLAAWLSE
jgi:hypothetical protein